MTSSQSISQRSNLRLLVTIVLTIWFVFVFLFAANDGFVRPPEVPPLPILFGVTVPIVVFLAAYWQSDEFRALILAADLRLLTAIQAWRAGGLVFIAFYVHDLLPGSFAWPAGLGDIAIGVTAPWVMLTLIRQPTFVSSPLFVTWNVLGILDLVIAVSTGALNSGFVPGFGEQVATAPMAQLPLVLIPAFLVPLFIMLHLTALFQARRFKRGY